MLRTTLDSLLKTLEGSFYSKKTENSHAEDVEMTVVDEDDVMASVVEFYSELERRLSIPAAKRKRHSAITPVVILHFGLHRSTLHLAAGILDRFLALVNARMEASMELQLCALACIMIAGKKEEILPPDLPAYASLLLSLDAEDPQQSIAARRESLQWSQRLCTWELQILDCLGWQLLLPTTERWAGIELVLWEEAHGRAAFSSPRDHLLLDGLLDAALLDPRLSQSRNLARQAIALVRHEGGSHIDTLLARLYNQILESESLLICIPSHPYEYRNFFGEDRDFDTLTFCPHEVFAANAALLEYFLDDLAE